MSPPVPLVVEICGESVILSRGVIFKIDVRFAIQNRMSEKFFGALRSGIKFPEVVMNQGPLPNQGRSK